MIEAVSQWAVGFILLTMLIKIMKVQASGSFAIVILTVVPYGLGVFIFAVFGVDL